MLQSQIQSLFWEKGVMAKQSYPVQARPSCQGYNEMTQCHCEGARQGDRGNLSLTVPQA